MITCWGLQSYKQANVVHCHIVISNSSSIPDDKAVNWKSIPNSYFFILGIYSQKGSGESIPKYEKPSWQEVGDLFPKFLRLCLLRNDPTPCCRHRARERERDILQWCCKVSLAPSSWATWCPWQSVAWKHLVVARLSSFSPRMRCGIVGHNQGNCHLYPFMLDATIANLVVVQLVTGGVITLQELQTPGL